MLLPDCTICRDYNNSGKVKLWADVQVRSKLREHSANNAQVTHHSDIEFVFLCKTSHVDVMLNACGIKFSHSSDNREEKRYIWFQEGQNSTH